VKVKLCLSSLFFFSSLFKGSSCVQRYSSQTAMNFALAIYKLNEPSLMENTIKLISSKTKTTTHPVSGASQFFTSFLIRRSFFAALTGKLLMPDSC